MSHTAALATYKMRAYVKLRNTFNFDTFKRHYYTIISLFLRSAWTVSSIQRPNLISIGGSCVLHISVEFTICYLKNMKFEVCCM